MNEIFSTKLCEEATCRHAARLAEIEAESGGTKDGRPTDGTGRYVTRFIQQGRPDLAADLLERKARGEEAEALALERIIAQNELMGVAFFEGGIKAARAVCRISVKDGAGHLRGYGTGFMVSPSLMMTNNHVLADMDTASASTIEFDYMLDAAGNTAVPQRFRLQPGRFFQTDPASRLDFTLVAVEPVNAEGQQLAARGWIHLIAASGKAVVGEPINIIQHPAGERMQIAIRENFVLGPEGDYFIYSTDTKGGSSGSPALNDQWQLAALHHAGVPAKDDAGNWLKTDGTPFRQGIDAPESIHWVANEGVRVSRIVEEMRARPLSPEHRALFELCFTPAPLGEMAGHGGLGSPAGLFGGGRLAGGHWDVHVQISPPGTVAPPSVSAPAAALPDTQVQAEASVFESRGPYYDAPADQAAAEAYYSGIDAGLTKAEMYDALHGLVKATHETVFTYDKARHRHLYPWIDRHPDETLKSIYSGAAMAEELFLAEMAAFEAEVRAVAEAKAVEVMALSDVDREMIDLALEASSAFNCEHVVPQSWFKGEAEKKAQKADLHHLFTCEWGCNSFRGNIPYSEFSDAEEAEIRGQEISVAEAMLDPALEASRPQCGLRDGKRFEPAAGKGAVARATLYFVLRYPGAVGDVKRGSKKEFVKSNVGLLLDWAEAEPPGLYEWHRNAEIARVQGNRNPLIDRPEWLGKVDFGKGFG